MAKTLTDLSVKKLEPTSERREIPDANQHGLRLVIQPSGSKSWAMRFRRPDGKHGKQTLGPADLSGREAPKDPKTGKPITPKIGSPLNLTEARWIAADIEHQRNSGLDVIADHKINTKRRRDANTERASNSFGSIAREFFVKHRAKKREARPRRWHEDAATLGLRYPKGSDPATVKPEVIKGSLVDTWDNRPIADFDKYEAEAVIEEARKHGSDSRARKLYSVLNVLFGWLPLKYGVEVNPMLGMKKRLGLGPPASGDRKLDKDEIVLLWKACDSLGVFGALYKTLLLTGCRLREPAGMVRSELNGGGVWEIPGARTKNHLPFLVPLPALALDVINSVPAIGGAGLVFTTNGRTGVSGFSKAKRALDAAMRKIAGKPIQPWRVHDLRRTFSTTLNESPDDGGLGIAPHIVEACLNHISGEAKSGVAGVYNKAKHLSEKRMALERWANHIEGLVTDRKADVLPMPAVVMPMAKRG
jgi:integrase